LKRFVSGALALFLVLSLCATEAAAVSTQATCAILMDADSERILFEKNIHERRLIASITKLMTALVAAEHSTDLDCSITIQREWLGSEGSSMYLQPNEQLSMRGLLYGLLLQSGNDAAVAIACHIAGDVAAFSKMMNDKAAELGMRNSHFVNPSGLNEEGHYSTAYDMALLAKACLKNKIVAEICATSRASVGSRTFYNHNKLLGLYDGCVGMKTGYTELAGRTLVSAAVRNGQTLICVTLNDPNDWEDHMALFDYGFSTYPMFGLCEEGQVFGSIKVTGSLIPSVPVVAAEALSYPLAAGETLAMKVEFAHDLRAPISAGMPVGWAAWYLNGALVAETELICLNGANFDLFERETFWHRLLRENRRCAQVGGIYLI